ncbi:MAG TPA: hypothetical protein VLT33_07985, partial [Labilithrix sp.]|nr:hypothetical protein [Labilithrix sp.]
MLVAPGRLPAGRVVEARVRDVDLAPTVCDLLGLETDPRASGRSLLALAQGEPEKDERPVVTEEPGMQALLHGRHRLVLRGATAQLFDVVADPGQRRDLAKQEPERVAELRARLVAALANVPVAGSPAATAARRAPVLHLRFATAGRARRVSGTIVVGDPKASPATFTLEPVELGRDTFK